MSTEAINSMSTSTTSISSDFINLQPYETDYYTSSELSTTYIGELKSTGDKRSKAYPYEYLLTIGTKSGNRKLTTFKLHELWTDIKCPFKKMQLILECQTGVRSLNVPNLQIYIILDNDAELSLYNTMRSAYTYNLLAFQCIQHQYKNMKIEKKMTDGELKSIRSYVLHIETDLLLRTYCRSPMFYGLNLCSLYTDLIDIWENLSPETFAVYQEEFMKRQFAEEENDSTVEQEST